MVYDNQTGTADIRAQVFDAAIKQISNRKYKFKQAVSIVSTGAWKNYFFREKQAVLAGQSGNAVKGIPRGAEFPHAVVEWDRIQTTIQKYGLSGRIDYEDLISAEIDVQNRTLVKLAEGVTKAVDDEIYTVLADTDGAGGNINTVTAYAGWNQSSAAIIDDLGAAEQAIAEDDYDTDTLMLFINPRDKRSLQKYITDKGAQWPSVSEDTAVNGKIMRLLNYDIIVSRSVPASRALVVIPKRCATWKALDPLKTVTEEQPGMGVTITSWEMGVTQLTDPGAVCLISGTQL